MRLPSLRTIEAPPALPRLAFGEGAAQITSDVDANIATLKRAVPELEHFEPLGPRQGFSQKAASVVVGDVVMVANASTPVRVDVGQGQHCSISVPVGGGSATVRADGLETRLSAGGAALYFPNACARATRTHEGFSVLMVRLSEDRLASTAAAMHGVAVEEAHRLLPAVASVLPLQHTPTPFVPAIAHLCGLVDDAGLDPRVLSMLGVDDMLYRLLASMLVPLAQGAPHRSRLAARAGASMPQALARACDYALAHLAQPLGLTELEHASGLSARALQMAFRKRFDCTPMEWVRDQRLQMARERLQGGDIGTSVTAVALDCGFTRLSAFARCYFRRYGELPSDTLARQRPFAAPALRADARTSQD